MSENVYHIPALLGPSIDGLNIDRGGVYVDVTFGGGGHSRAILERLGSDGRLYGFDQDLDALENAPADDPRFTFVHSNFRYLANFMRYYGVESIDGLIADLGVSFHHFDDAERGFSFRADAPLDMRMNKAAQLTAAQIIADYEQERLADLFYNYGELRQSRQLAAAIVKARRSGDIATTSQLAAVAAPYIKRQQEKKEMAQLFQALRMEVNHETDALRAMLAQAAELLRPGGRLVVLTYHSIEDRMVKNFIRTGNCDGRAEKDFYGVVHAPLVAVNNKVITADEAEVERNPRSRSAKLRIAAKPEAQ